MSLRHSALKLLGATMVFFERSGECYARDLVLALELLEGGGIDGIRLTVDVDDHTVSLGGGGGGFS